MKREENYFIYLSSAGRARPMRRREEVMRQIRAVTSPCVVPIGIGEGLVLHCITEQGGACDRLNYRATVLLGERGRSVLGDAVLCRIRDDDYAFFEKRHAQAMCDIINLL